MVQELAPLEVHQGYLGLYLIVMLKQHIAHLEYGWVTPLCIYCTGVGRVNGNHGWSMGLITPLYNTVWLG